MTNFTSTIFELTNRRALKESNLISARISLKTLIEQVKQQEYWLAEDEAELYAIDEAIRLLEAAHRLGQ